MGGASRYWPATGALLAPPLGSRLLGPLLARSWPATVYSAMQRQGDPAKKEAIRKSLQKGTPFQFRLNLNSDFTFRRIYKK